MTSKPRGKKAKLMDVEFMGGTERLSVCPYRQRLCVRKNPGERKGFLILRLSDGALVAWARRKCDADPAMEKLEALEPFLAERDVWEVREALAPL